MKHIKILAAMVLTFFAWSSVAAHDIYGYTFFSIYPPFQTGTPERDLFSQGVVLGCEPCEWGTGLTAAAFGGFSTSPREISRFFMPFGKISLLVAETGAVGAENRDVSARHLNIETLDNTFKSFISFSPQQHFAGAGFVYRQRLWHDDCGLVRGWLEISSPLVNIRNSMGFSEVVINNGGGVVDAIGLDNSPRVGTAKEAFEQPSWKYGRIEAGTTMTRTGFADIELKIGYRSIAEETHNLRSFVGLVIPTGNTPCGRFVFEPIVGNNGHLGVMWGSHYDIKIWSCDDQYARVDIDFHARYLFSNHQVRTFDLKDREWSRYMETYRSPLAARFAEETDNARSGTSGINLFTVPMRVWPRFLSTVMSSITYVNGSFRGALGYSVFMRQAEFVDFDYPRKVALKHADGLGQTTFARTIKDDFNPVINDTFHYAELSERNVNFGSAAHPSTLATSVYGAIAYLPADESVHASVGVSYEFATINTVLDRFTGWIKAGFSF